MTQPNPDQGQQQQQPARGPKVRQLVSFDLDDTVTGRPLKGLGVVVRTEGEQVVIRPLGVGEVTVAADSVTSPNSDELGA